MADSLSPAPPFEVHRLLQTQDNAPTISSPLNPDVKPRAQRERKETAKKREATRGSTPTVPSKRKAPGSGSGSGNPNGFTQQQAPSPTRYVIPEPKAQDYEPPKQPVFVSHEPTPLLTPDGSIELKKVADHAENKRGFRYSLAVADPQFRHKQFYRQSDGIPYGPRMSFEDADRNIHYATSALMLTNDRGWRMSRANVCAREGSMYYEVRIVRGEPLHPLHQQADTSSPQPHVRMGWARREAPLDAPVGFDGYSYAITDTRLEPMHRSRPSKFFSYKTNNNGTKSKTPVTIQVDDKIREGDVVGLEIALPSLSLHQKVVQGHYNPAVDLGHGFEDAPSRPDPTQDAHHIIRDRIPVTYKNNVYFETMDYIPTKFMEAYADRTLSLSSLNTPAAGAPSLIKSAPNPHHAEPALRTLPHSHIRVYKNGNLIGTAFDNLLAFLPPASLPSKIPGSPAAFDDGMLGYYPAVSCFHGGTAEMNFGDKDGGFWMPPAHLKHTVPTTKDPDTNMSDADQDQRYHPARTLRPIGERFREQIAEDILSDIIDEIDFFMQDGGFGGKVGAGVDAAKQGVASLKEEVVD